MQDCQDLDRSTRVCAYEAVQGSCHLLVANAPRYSEPSDARMRMAALAAPAGSSLGLLGPSEESEDEARDLVRIDRRAT